MKFGELELYILSDGTHTEDGGGMFETSFSIGIINKITNAKGEIEYKVRKVENIQR